jgi:ferric-dicitrate binding protein FerR (iron transport regulator)
LEVKKVKQLLRRYLLGKSPEKEHEAVENWYRSFDESPVIRMDPEEEQRIRQEIWQTIQPQISVAKSFYLRTARHWMVAAVILAGIVSAGYFIFFQPPAYTEIITANGERRTIQMEDGSRLSLNAGSSIRISKDFSRERKLNIVDGEIFVEVKGDMQKPFIVESGPLVTTVLGTSFHVSAYEAIHKMSVGVVSGKVSVQAGGDVNILEKGRELVYDRQKGRSQVAALDPASLEWRQGRLVLNDASFDEMSVLMEKNFGIHITSTAEHVRSTRYTTELPTSMDPVKAAEVLAAIHRLKIKANNNQVLIY